MLLYDILGACNDRYNNVYGSCIENCRYAHLCNGNCGKCLEYVHYPQRCPEEMKGRGYNCRKMADYYTCKYSYRYASEIVYALQCCTDVMHKSELKILSLGCGPCTDLYALDICSRINLMADRLDYRGVEKYSSVWGNIHNDILQKAATNARVNVKIYYDDMCSYICKTINDSWRPDIVIFQYSLSDMWRNSNDDEKDMFMRVFARYCNEILSPNIYVVLNDINFTGNLNERGSEPIGFGELQEHLQASIVRKGYFPQEKNCFVYNAPFQEKELFFDAKHTPQYAPFDCCGSAQLVLQVKNSSCKVGE